jgi:formylglycine-generating enzyme required for sulfatase activity
MTAQGPAPAPPDLGWVLVLPGTFAMGCVPGDADCGPEELPRHPVTISHAFELMAAEVTVAQFRLFTRATGATAPPAPRFPQADDHPVVNVSWDDADAFCAWAGGQLPTEAAWELAARAGESTHLYPWGDTPSHDRANYGADECCSGLAVGEDRWENTAPVRSFPANPYGLFDMGGNVWEWVADWFAPYPAGPVTDPTGPPSGALHLVRGGSWLNFPAALRTSSRLPFTGQVSNIGFRCARRPVGVRFAVR